MSEGLILLLFVPLNYISGLDNYDSWDFLRISMLGCFCAINHHGTEMLLCFSAVVQQTPFPPVGFNVLKAGLIKSVIFSVCTSQSTQRQQGSSNGMMSPETFSNATVTLPHPYIPIS